MKIKIIGSGGCVSTPKPCCSCVLMDREVTDHKRKLALQGFYRESDSSIF